MLPIVSLFGETWGFIYPGFQSQTPAVQRTVKTGLCVSWKEVWLSASAPWKKEEAVELAMTV